MASDEQRRSTLYGARTESFGPLAAALEAALNLANYPRYGMSERDRSQLIGRLPGSPSYGPEAERYTSGYLFARQNPSLGFLLGPANTITDWMYGTDLGKHAVAGAKAFAESGVNPQDPNAETPQEIAEREDKRRTLAAALLRKFQR